MGNRLGKNTRIRKKSERARLIKPRVYLSTPERVGNGARARQNNTGEIIDSHRVELPLSDAGM